MEQTCIELHFVFTYFSFYTDTAEVFIPCSVGFRLCLIEGEIFCFRLQIMMSVFNGGIREASLDGNTFLILCVEGQVNTGTRSCFFGHAYARRSAFKNSKRRWLLIDHSREVHTDFRTRLILLNIYRKSCNKT